MSRSELTRALILYRVSLASAWHRLRSDLGGELVVLISSLVLFATFLYVFDDFLNVQVASLSPAMRRSFGSVGAVLLGAITALATARILRTERFDQQGIAQTACALGETKAARRLYRILHDATVIVVLHGICWYLTLRYLAVWPNALRAGVEAAMLALSLGLSRLGPRRDAAEAQQSKTLDWSSEPRSKILWSWRLRQIVRRNRATQACLVVGSLCLVPVFLAAVSGLPSFVACFAALAGGFFVAAPESFQLAEDLKSAWTERALGITHHEIVATYVRIGLTLGAAFGIPAAALYLVGSAAGGSWALMGDATWPTVNAALKTLALGVLPGLVFPYVMFQIDARRPAIGLMAGLIVSLFLGTAIYAHWLSLLIPVILTPYARSMQAGRFYRA